MIPDIIIMLRRGSGEAALFPGLIHDLVSSSRVMENFIKGALSCRAREDVAGVNGEASYSWESQWLLCMYKPRTPMHTDTR